MVVIPGGGQRDSTSSRPARLGIASRERAARRDQPHECGGETQRQHPQRRAQADGLREHGAEQRAGRRQQARRDLPCCGRAPQRFLRQQPLAQRGLVDEVDRHRAVADDLLRDQEQHGDPRHGGGQRNEYLHHRGQRERRHQRAPRAPARRGGRGERRADRGRRCRRSRSPCRAASGDNPRSRSAYSVYSDAMKLPHSVNSVIAQNSVRIGRRPPHDADARAHVIDERRGRGRLGRRLVLADARDQQRGHDERRGVGQDGERRRPQRHQRSAERGARDFGDRVDGAALAVRVEQPLARHEVGDEHVVGEIEQHRADAGDRRDRIQDRQRQHMAQGGERDGRERHRADQVGRDQQRAAAMAVDPAARDPMRPARRAATARRPGSRARRRWRR